MMVIRIIGPPMTIHVGNDETLKKKKGLKTVILRLVDRPLTKTHKDRV